MPASLAPAIAAPDVLCDRHRFEVGRVNARRISAEVVENQAFGDGAVHPFVDEPVRSDVTAFPKARNEAVTVRVPVPLPHPARRAVSAVSLDPFRAAGIFTRFLARLMAHDPADMFASDVADAESGGRCDRRRPSAAAEALAGGVGRGQRSSRVGMSLRGGARPAPHGVVGNRHAAVRTGVRLRGHCSDSSSESGGAVAGGVSSTRRPFALPPLYRRNRIAMRKSGVR